MEMGKGGSPGGDHRARALDVVIEAEQAVTHALQNQERQAGLEVCAPSSLGSPHEQAALSLQCISNCWLSHNPCIRHSWRAGQSKVLPKGPNAAVPMSFQHDTAVSHIFYSRTIMALRLVVSTIKGS